MFKIFFLFFLFLDDRRQTYTWMSGLRDGICNESVNAQYVLESTAMSLRALFGTDFAGNPNPLLAHKYTLRSVIRYRDEQHIGLILNTKILSGIR